MTPPAPCTDPVLPCHPHPTHTCHVLQDKGKCFCEQIIEVDGFLEGLEQDWRLRAAAMPELRVGAHTILLRTPSGQQLGTQQNVLRAVVVLPGHANPAAVLTLQRQWLGSKCLNCSKKASDPSATRTCAHLEHIAEHFQDQGTPGPVWESGPVLNNESSGAVITKHCFQPPAQSAQAAEEFDEALGRWNYTSISWVHELSNRELGEAYGCPPVELSMDGMGGSSIAVDKELIAGTTDLLPLHFFFKNYSP